MQIEQIRKSLLDFQKSIQELAKQTQMLEAQKDNLNFRNQLNMQRSNSHELSKKLAKYFANQKDQHSPEIIRLKKDFQKYENVQRTQLEKEKKINRQITHHLSVTKSILTANQTASYQSSSISSNPEDEEEDLKAMKSPLLLEVDEEFLLNREKEIRELEKDMLEVGNIFKDLGDMVKEQGEQLDNIEMNVMQAGDEIDNANEEVINAAKYQHASTRKVKWICMISLTAAAITGVLLYLMVFKK